MWEKVLDCVWAAVGLLDGVVEECAVVVAEGKGGGVGDGYGVGGRWVSTESWGIFAG